MTGISISFGALSPQIKDQLNKQGYTLSEKDEALFQHLTDALVMVKLHRLFADSVCDMARKRLMKQIVKSIVEVPQ